MEFQSSEEHECLIVTLSGDINETCTAALTTIRGKINATKVVFDCQRIRRINSIGAAAWIEFLKDVQDRRQLIFRHCPPVFIGYCNAMSTFIGQGLVESFAMPYYCKACDDVFQIMTKVDAARLLRAAPSTTTACPKCHGTAKPETDPEVYLGFLP